MESLRAGQTAQGGSPGAKPRNPIRFGRFVILFCVYLLAGNLLLLLPPVRTGFVDPWTAANASWAVGAARFLGLPCQASGIMISAGEGRLAIKPGCNGVHALMLCLSAILVYPASWRRRLLGVALAAVGVFGLNLVRLVNLFFVADRFPSRLEFFHVYVWQTLIALLAFGIFLAWGSFLAGAPGGTSRAGGG
jgi:exosortase H (IPTLxxWG-CTERM-specific)